MAAAVASSGAPQTTASRRHRLPMAAADGTDGSYAIIVAMSLRWFRIDIPVKLQQGIQFDCIHLTVALDRPFSLFLKLASFRVLLSPFLSSSSAVAAPPPVVVAAPAAEAEAGPRGGINACEYAHASWYSVSVVKGTRRMLRVRGGSKTQSK